MINIIVACISGILSLAGVIITNSAHNKKIQKQNQENMELYVYRIEQLEKKQDKHNQIVERVYGLEAKVDHIEENLEDMKRGK